MITEQDLKLNMDREMRKWDIDRLLLSGTDIGMNNEIPKRVYSYDERHFKSIYGKYPTQQELDQFNKNKIRNIKWSLSDDDL